MTDEFAGFVEARLTDIQFDVEKKRICLNFYKTAQKESIKIKCDGVEEFSISGCKLQNIAEEILISSRTDRTALLTNITYLLNELFYHESVVKELSAAYSEKVQLGELTLMSVEPLYGARITVLASGIQLIS